MGQVSGLNAPIRHDSVDGRFDLRVGQHHLHLFDLSFRRIEHGLRRCQGLLGGGFPFKKLLRALILRTGLVELGFCSSQFLANVTIVQRDQDLVFFYAISRRGKNAAHVGRDARAQVDLFFRRGCSNDLDAHRRCFSLNEDGVRIGR